jgi:putative membrane protein
MGSFLDGLGFLGTKAPVRSDITLILIIITAILFTIGWRLALHKRYEAHRWVQTSAAILNAIVVLLAMVKVFVVYIVPGIPDKLFQGSYGATALHGLVGAIGLVLGIFIVLRANNLLPKGLQFKNYKLFMRTSYGIYMSATFLGVIVYIMAYIIGM